MEIGSKSNNNKDNNEKEEEKEDSIKHELNKKGR